MMCYIQSLKRKIHIQVAPKLGNNKCSEDVQCEDCELTNGLNISTENISQNQ